MGGFFRGFNWGFNKFKNGYVDVSHGLIRKAVVGVLILAAFMGADLLVGRKLPTSFLPDEDYGFLFLSVQLPPAASLERTDEVTRKIEAILANTPGVQTYTTIDGFSLLTRVSTTNNAFLFCQSQALGRENRLPILRPRPSWRTSIASCSPRCRRPIAFVFSPPAIPGIRQRRRILVLAARPQRRLGRRS